MSNLGEALLAELDDEHLAQLAERLRPYLAPEPAREADEDGWLRGGRGIAAYLGAPRSRVYALVSAGRLPAVQHDGSSLVARRADLDAFIEAGGAKRP